MNIAELIKNAGKTAFSFEVLPPLKGTGIEGLWETIDTLMAYNPLYINITTHRSEYCYEDAGEGLWRRRWTKRRPGTVAVAAAIKNRYGVTPVPHIVCSGCSKEETEYALLDLQYLGITDLLVLRGDKARHQRIFTPEPDGWAHALDLQGQIERFNEGLFEDGSAMSHKPAVPFSYGVACYPEKHEEAPNLQTDLHWLAKKVEAGAQYAVTQLFYDNTRYFDFVRQAKDAGISVPILPGIKPLRRKAQLTVIPQTFKVDIPRELARRVDACKDDKEVEQVGVEWCIRQCRELMEHGVPSIHFYAMGAAESIARVAKEVYQK